MFGTLIVKNGALALGNFKLCEERYEVKNVPKIPSLNEYKLETVTDYHGTELFYIISISICIYKRRVFTAIRYSHFKLYKKGP